MLTYAAASLTTETRRVHPEHRYPYDIVDNSVLRKSTSFNSIRDSIQTQTKTTFYKNYFSHHDHIRLLGIARITRITKHVLKPYPLARADRPTEPPIFPATSKGTRPGELTAQLSSAKHV